MNDQRDLLERVGQRFDFPEDSFDRLLRRRERRVRNQRIASGMLAFVVSLLAIAGLIRAFSAPPDTGDGTPSPSPLIEPTTTRVSFVDVRSGSATALPGDLAQIPAAGQFQVSPDGEMLAFVGFRRGDVRNWPMQLNVADVDGTNLREITHDQDIEASDPRWSPDGSKIVYVGDVFGELNLFVVDLTTGRRTQVTQGLGDDPALIEPTPHFSPDGRTILYTKAEGGYLALWTVPSTGGESTEVIRNAAYGSYSPDGTTIAYHQTGPITGSSLWPTYLGITLVDADGTGRRSLDDQGSIVAPIGWGKTRPMWSPDSARLVYALYGFEHPDRIRIVEASTGEATDIGTGSWPSWLDDETLILENYEAG